MDPQLLAFVTVADQQNFTRAAEVLHTTQPAVSQHIRNLERRMGARLLDRTNKFVRLNRAGEVVYHHAKEILSLYARMERLVEDMQNQAAGTLSIGSSLSYGEYVLPHTIARFRKLFPHITPAITIENTAEVVEQVAKGGLDVGIIEGSAWNDNVHVEAFAEDTVVIVASSHHPFAAERTVTAQQFAEETWIVREQGSGTREITDEWLARHHIRPTSMMEFGSTQLIKESVEAGLGITILSTWVIRKELLLKTLSVIPLGEAPMHRHFSMVTRKSDFQTKASQLFQTFLRSKKQLTTPLED